MAAESSRASGVDGSGGSHGELDLYELLECPVCVNTMHPPIYQCKNGHALCFTCRAEVDNQCPSCRGTLGDIRCLALEKVAETLRYSCEYESKGCREVLPYSIKPNHEARCGFRLYDCPFHQCSAVGNISDLVAHLKSDHQTQILDGCLQIARYQIQQDDGFRDRYWKPIVLHCYEHHFYLLLESFYLSGAPTYMVSIRFMGEDSEAKKYSYGITVETNGRKMAWEGIPRSIRDSDNDVRDSLDGFVIHNDVAVFFFEGDTLSVGCWIRQKGETAESTSRFGERITAQELLQKLYNDMQFKGD